jgi:hypothetical protein
MIYPVRRVVFVNFICFFICLEESPAQIHLPTGAKTASAVIGSRLIAQTSRTYNSYGLEIDTAAFYYSDSMFKMPNYYWDQTHFQLPRYKYDSMLGWRFVTSTGVYIPSVRDVMTYDPLHRPIARQFYFWDTVANHYGNPYNINTYSYDAMGNLVVDTEKLTPYFSVSGSWDSGAIYVTYDANRRVTSRLEKIRDALTGVYVNSARFAYVYDGNGDIASDTEYKWNNSANVWDNVEYDLFYNVANKPVKFSQIWWNKYTNSWENWNLYTYSYDASNNLTQSIYQYWESSSGSYSNMFRKSYYYNFNNDDTLLVEYNWLTTGTGTWGLNDCYLMSYDGNHNQVSWTHQNWGGVWENDSKVTCSYNSYNQVLTSIGYTWNADTAIWTPNNRTDCYYELYTYDPTGVKQATGKSEAKIKLYPSPANVILNIYIDLPVEQNASFTILDAFGNIWYQSEVLKIKTCDEQLSIANLPTGNYFVRVVSENTVLNERFLIVR